MTLRRIELTQSLSDQRDKTIGNEMEHAIAKPISLSAKCGAYQTAADFKSIIKNKQVHFKKKMRKKKKCAHIIRCCRTKLVTCPLNVHTN
ncbi:hypothetical protein BpHYR1_010629 [Brachionus plicatilis]|uniref:Uncharacterized protein n=1 Tax=Brachionus plicatilis TaxID=10195 RepID=A0A3M7S7B3_BRAPC|nr:hypothetical protein BpHYR1_010629 [Brachionus plicatilis]